MTLLRSILSILILCFISTSSFAANWVDTKTHDGIAYFLYSSPALVKRYDLANQVFLSNIEFESLDPASALAVDEDGMFVGFGRQVSRFDLTGNNSTNLGNTSSDIQSIVTSEFNIYVHYGDFLKSISKNNNQTIETQDYFYTMKGLSYSKANNRLYARNSGVSPSDILYMDLPDDGSLPSEYSGQIDSPYHGDYPNADITFMFPDESRVIDSSGVVYAATNLSYVGSVSGAFTDISFYVDLPILLRDGELISYNNALLETGRFSYAGVNVEKIDTFGDNVFGFYEDDIDSILKVLITDIELLSPAEPGEPIDPNGLAYSPDKIIVGDDGIAYILSKSHLSIFRWSLVQQRYLTTIPLINVPNFMAYSAENQSLYIAYEAGQINKIPLDGLFQERAFASLPQRSLGLSTAGEFIFAVDPSGAWVSHYIFDKEGLLLSQKEWNYTSDDFVWNSVNRRMYHFRDETSPNDLHWEEISADGIIGEMGDSPYHSSTGIEYPLKVSPDGSTIVLGSGRIYDGITLSQTDNLSNNIDDAVWNDGKLYTLRASTQQSGYQEWNPLNNYSLDREQTVNGAPIKLLQARLNNLHWLTLMSDLDGVPVFRPISLAGDLDIDQDTVQNIFDNCIYTSNLDQSDGNLDGIGDACENDFDNDQFNNQEDNCPTVPNSDQSNIDNDGYGDVCDEDIDGDNTINALDCLAKDTLAWQYLDGFLDHDEDGYPDGQATKVCSGESLLAPYFAQATDNCEGLSNPDQLNTDLDPFGDACDSDDDNDTILDGPDNCPTIENTDQLNTDSDEHGDICDSDLDNDGVLNGADIAPLNPMMCEDSDVDSCDDCSAGNDGFGPLADNDVNNDGVDTNSDGVCDLTDPDDDSDHINDEVDNCPLVENPDQLDINENGTGDVCEVNGEFCIPIKAKNGFSVICL